MIQKDNALLQQAMALHEANKFGEAATIYRDLLAKDPENVMLMHLLALIAMQMDNAEMVLSLAETGLKLQPKFAVLHQDKATALRRLGHQDKALESIKQALLLEPSYTDFYETLALILRDMRQYKQAVEALQIAVKLEPENPKLYNSLGITLSRAGLNEEALQNFDKYLSMRPDKAEGHNNRANVLKACGRYREAIAAYEKALGLNPDIFMGRANKGIAHLILGEWEEGWDLFEGRMPGCVPPEGHRFDLKRRWKGEAIPPGKTLLIYNEQGMGDTIQFCRYIPQLLPRAEEIIFQVQAPLLALMRYCWPGFTFITPEEPLPDYDLQCPFMSLPHIFGTRVDNVPLSNGYLKAESEKITAWRERLPKDGKKKIGLVWAGNPDHMNDHIRSIPLPLYEALWKQEGAHFFSLQKGDKAVAQIKALGAIPLQSLGEELTNFSDTAALLTQLDLLITVDTSVLHLAGSLGCPAWALIQSDPDWRWLMGRPDTPWYDSVRLFRQEKLGEWGKTVNEAAQALHTFIAS